jgi:hypothetical protein
MCGAALLVVATPPLIGIAWPSNSTKRAPQNRHQGGGMPSAAAAFVPITVDIEQHARDALLTGSTHRPSVMLTSAS